MDIEHKYGRGEKKKLVAFSWAISLHGSYGLPRIFSFLCDAFKSVSFGSLRHMFCCEGNKEG